jgi:uncharacterized protein YeeX (DUF496 family)
LVIESYNSRKKIQQQRKEIQLVTSIIDWLEMDLSKSDITQADFATLKDMTPEEARDFIAQAEAMGGYDNLAKGTDDE